jgi:hypothetical protein
VSEDAEIEPWTAAALAMAVRCSNHAWLKIPTPLLIVHNYVVVLKASVQGFLSMSRILTCLVFRETMEQNEQVIFKVYEEKERVWEKEIR